MVDFIPFTGLAATDNNTQYQANSVVTTANAGTVIAATSMVIVPATGYVGIGTTNPLSNLDIRGNASATGSLNVGGAAILNSLVVNTSITFGSFNIIGTLQAGSINSNTTIQSAGTTTANALISNVYGLFGQNVTVNSTNASTATTNGALVVAGGIGIGGNINTGGSVNLFTGQIGVGTTTSAGFNPSTNSSNIYVWGNVVISNTASTSSGVIFPDGTIQTSAAAPSSSTLSYGLNGTVQFANTSNTFLGDSTNFFWDNSNKRLGIGTSTPSTVMSVYGDTPALFNTRTGGGVRQEIFVSNTTSFGAVLGYDSTVGTSGGYGYLRRGESPVGTPAVSFTYVLSNHRVGINGVTQPQNALDVSGAVAIGNSYAGLSALTNTNGMSVQGRVGIGTFTPNITNNNILTLFSATGAGIELVSGGASAGGGNIQGSSGGGLVFSTFTGGVANESYTERMRIDSNGDVGLGVVNPLSTVDVGGIASFRGAISVAGATTVSSLTSNGAITGTTGAFSTSLYGDTFNTAGTATVNALVSNGSIGGTTATLSNATGPQITFTGVTSQWVQWPATGIGAPTFTTSSVGTKLLLYPFVAAAAADYAIGIESNTMWFGVPTTSPQQFKWYGGTTQAMLLSGAGALSTTSTTTSTAFIPSGATVPTNGMFLPAANTLGFATGSVEDMRLAPNGNLLVGLTTLPAGGNATVVLEGLGTNGGGIELLGGSASGGGLVSGLSAGGMAFATFTGVPGSEVYTERMRVNSAGNVIIGMNTSSNVSIRDNGKLTVVGGQAGTNQASAALITPGYYNGERADLALWSTFNATAADSIPRRTADIIAGFNAGNWGNEYLSFNVGNAGVSNDSATVTIERMRLASNGNLLVGLTTLPAGGNATVVLEGLGTNGGGIELIGGSASGGGLVSGLSAGGMAFATFTGVPGSEVYTERMRIDVNGNVGIGTATVSTGNIFAVYGRSFHAGNVQIANTTVGSAGIFFPDGTYQATAATGSGGVLNFSGGTTGFTPSVLTAGSITLAGTLIAANGGTGQSTYAIGDILYASTTTALSRLAAVATGQVIVSAGAGTAPAYSGTPTLASLTLNTASGPQLTFSGATSNFINFGTVGDGAPAFTTRSVGTKIVYESNITAISVDYAVGVVNTSTTAPLSTAPGTLWWSVPAANILHRFQWYGGTTALATLWGNGNLAVTGEVTAYFSDVRLKDNVVIISDAVHKVKQIRGVYYNASDAAVDLLGEDKTVQKVGLLAQEVEAILPNVIRPAPFDVGSDGVSKSGENYLTLQYERVIPLLVQAIKEQQTQIEAQQVQIDSLLARITRLEPKP